MKIWRWLSGVSLILALSSCGIFFAPLEGRWNPNDPQFGDGYTRKSLYPTVDGQMMSGGTSLTEGITMAVSSGMYLTLLKFPTGDIPEDVPHAELRLYMDTEISTMPYPELHVRLILKDWDAATVSWDQVTTTEGFVAPNASPSVLVRYAGWYAWDLTPLLNSANPSSVKGLLLESVVSGMTAYFWTKEQSTNQPYLAIWTK
jgi:hypothetical protein